jgi:exodeoxyribonuclease-3
MIKKIKIGTFYVNSLFFRSKYVLEILEEYEPDFFALQELKCENSKIPEEILNHEKYQIFCNCQKAYNGSAILVKKSILLEANYEFETKDFFDQSLSHEARYLEIQIKIFNKKFLFSSIYVPNGSEVGSEKFEFKIKFLQSLKKYIEEKNKQQNLHFGLLGDFNIAPFEIDLSRPVEFLNSIGFSKEERKIMREILNSGFYDCFRILHSSKEEYSWFDYRAQAFEKNDGMRIDLILANKNLINFLSSCQIEKKWRALERPSDHLPVFAEFIF